MQNWKKSLLGRNFVSGIDSMHCFIFLWNIENVNFFLKKVFLQLIRSKYISWCWCGCHLARMILFVLHLRRHRSLPCVSSPTSNVILGHFNTHLVKTKLSVTSIFTQGFLLALNISKKLSHGTKNKQKCGEQCKISRQICVWRWILKRLRHLEV